MQDPEHIIREALARLDDIEDERAALQERRKAAMAPLLDDLSLSRRAIAAFLKRRKLTDEQRIDFDAHFARLCAADGEPFQPDLFDMAAQQHMAAAGRKRAGTH